MKDWRSLEKKIEAQLGSTSGRQDLSERILLQKWSSFSTMYHCGIDSQVDEFLSARKNDIVKFYIENPQVVRGLPNKIEEYESSLEKLSGKSTDPLGLFLGGFCSQIRTWSYLMEHMCKSNSDAAAKVIFSSVSANSVPGVPEQSLLKDLSGVLSSGGKIHCSLDSMILCRHALAPVISEHNFHFTKQGDMYSSPDLSLIEPLKILQTNTRPSLRLTH